MTTASVEDRIALIETILNDPPRVHAFPDGQLIPQGAWRSADRCYEFMARHVTPDSRTLETGLGVSTVLFAGWGADHTCVVGNQLEVDRCLEYLEARGLPSQRITFLVGSSDQVLPRLTAGEVDLFFIDGCHGYPLPVIDWFYGAALLRRSGILVVDDADLPQVGDFLVKYLRADPRWNRVGHGSRWVAFQRLSSGGLGEEWRSQPFLGIPFKFRPAVQKAGRAIPKARRILGRP
jgi:hypothetical protein